MFFTLLRCSGVFSHNHSERSRRSRESEESHDRRCHSEERSDEESLGPRISLAAIPSRSRRGIY
jgi:hypothetical protein